MDDRSRHPLRTLALWVAAVVVLALLGSGLTQRLAPTSIVVSGSPSARAEAMLGREFGSDIPVSFLLQGPPGAVDRQGRALAAALRAVPRVRVISPWGAAGSGLAILRPHPDAALVIAAFERPVSQAVSEVVPLAQGLLRAHVHRPVQGHVGGISAIAAALQRDALSATQDAELLVAPILVVVLLLVFRSPVAAAVPLLMGSATVLAGRGLLFVTTYVLPVNALAVAIASMMGLALGVDYALLTVSRFRQERDNGADPEAAIATAGRAAGRTILFAGGTVALLMVTAALVAPGNLLESVAAGVVVSTMLSVLLALSLLPALLLVISPHLDRWRVPSFGRGERLVGLAGTAISRPWIAIPLIVLPMLAVAAPAGALSIGPPDPRQLPRSDPTRQGFEDLRRAIGPGWAAPIAVVATAKEGPISAGRRLAAISRWQDAVARDPAVAAVIGPASLAVADGPVARVRRAYRSAPARLQGARRDLASLRAGLAKAHRAVEGIRRGLGSAAAGAGTLAGRTHEAGAGAARLRRGAGEAVAGGARLYRGLGRADRGAGRLVRAQRRLALGAAREARGLRRLDETVRASMAELHALCRRLRAWTAWLRALRRPAERAATRLEGALAEMEAMTVGRTDPRYTAVLRALREAVALTRQELARSVAALKALPRRLERLAAGVHRLRRGAGEVAAGARATERGGRSLRKALRRLARGGRRLDRGLVSLRAGSARLGHGLAGIAAGQERLAGGLLRGHRRSGRLAAGLARPQGPLRRYELTLRSYGREYRALRSRSPGAADSGYLMLTALDGTVPGMHEEIDQVVNLEKGGQAVRMLIVPRTGPSAARTVALARRLRGELPALASASGTEVGIGEGAQTLSDYSEATMARIPWLVLALCAVSVLSLLVALRSLVLPVVAIALNLLTIAAAFGALQLFFGLGLLVGPRYIDAISAAGVLTIMFVLSVDYEVFLLTRIREAWLRRGEHIAAIEHGIGRTAGVITGAAAIMSSVFLAFATTDIASLQQFGAGLTFAVLLDATVVRLVLLPAVMRALGARAWWLPGWLDRLLPEFDHGEEASPGERLAAVADEEHRRLFDLLGRIEAAGAASDPARVTALTRELRGLAEPHFRYEQAALFPLLLDEIGPDRVERLYSAQAGVVESLARIEELAESATATAWGSAAADETRRLLGSIRLSIAACHGLAEVVEHQPAEVAELVLAARQRGRLGPVAADASR